MKMNSIYSLSHLVSRVLELATAKENGLPLSQPVTPKRGRPSEGWAFPLSEIIIDSGKAAAVLKTNTHAVKIS